MSMNLHCSECTLEQTPTWVTYMCVVQPDGSLPDELTGQKAKHALQIYKQWLRSRTDGAFETHEALQETHDWVKSEMEYIDSIVSKSKKLKVYWT